MTIGQRIKNRREELGLSQDELAKKLGYKSRTSINKLELGQRKIQMPKVKLIAEALSTTPEYIMGWEDKDEKNDDYINAVRELILSIPEEKREAFLKYLENGADIIK